MKQLKYFTMILLVLPVMAMADGKLKCSEWKADTSDELMYYEDQECTYLGTSLLDAMKIYFNQHGVISTKHLGSFNVVEKPFIYTEKVDGTIEKIKMYQTVKWKGKNKVEVSVCQDGTGHCSHNTFLLKGKVIKITGSRH